MDELLDVADVLVDLGGLDAAVWAARLLGVLALLAGAALWLLSGQLLVLPAVLLLAGGLLLVVPQLVLAVVELLG